MKNSMIDKLKEECGVFGIFGTNEINMSNLFYSALNALQHRGQESCGLVAFDGIKINCSKGMGLVKDVFTGDNFDGIMGRAAIGHVRYSTAGESNLNNAQPILIKSTCGDMALAHNGNITNVHDLRKSKELSDIEFSTTADSELILRLIEKSEIKDLEKAVLKVIGQIQGGYSVVLLTEEKLVGFRDPEGIRPLCIGRLKNSYVLSSESCALDAVGAEFLRDVLPGEIVVIDSGGLKSLYFGESRHGGICAFEYIYFARPESVIDGLNVYRARINLGKKLWEESRPSADVVIGVPDSGIISAIGFSQASGIPCDEGLIKNECVGRTFIEPSEEIRKSRVDIKLKAVKHSVEGKSIIVIDDSIVRGTTSISIVEILRQAGAREIHFMSAAPVIRHPCFWGINTPDSRELIGSGRTLENIRVLLGADSLTYISCEGLEGSLGIGDKICMKCFVRTM